MLNPAAQAMPPSTTSTKQMQVIQKVATNFSSGPSEEIPYAPIGAKRITILITPNTARVSDSSTSSSGLQRAPIADIAQPNSIEISTTCKISPLANASTTVVG